MINMRPFKLVELVLRILILAHFVGCMWMATAVYRFGLRDDETTWLVEWYATLVQRGERDEASEPRPFGETYFYTFYLALSNLVGNSVIEPTNDSERILFLANSLLSALTMGYIIGDIGALMTSLDRQASLVEEKLDNVGEYLRWRQLPRDLALRVRRYYVHFYTQRAVFDERNILQGLSPALHGEIVQFVLKDSLGRLPIIQRLSPEFQLLIFPMLKPRMLPAKQVVFRKGTTSDELLFLIEGEIKVLSWIDNTTPVMLIHPAERQYWTHFLSATDHESVETSFKSVGCFGQSVLKGTRRHATHVTTSTCELLTIDREDIVHIFKADPISAGRICHDVLKEDTLLTVVRKFFRLLKLGVMPASVERHALLLQVAWRRHSEYIAQQTDELSGLVSQAQVRAEEEQRQTIARRASLKTAKRRRPSALELGRLSPPLSDPGIGGGISGGSGEGAHLANELLRVEKEIKREMNVRFEEMETRILASIKGLALSTPPRKSSLSSRER